MVYHCINTEHEKALAVYDRVIDRDQELAAEIWNRIDERNSMTARPLEHMYRSEHGHDPQEAIGQQDYDSGKRHPF